MAGPRASRDDAVRRRSRRRDRERGAALHRHRPRLLPAEPPVGGERLRPDLRRLPAAGRARGRPARAPAHVHGRPGGVRPRVTRRRPCHHRGPADRGPCGAGPGRRHPRAGRALDRGRHLHRGGRAQQGHGRVGRRGRQRRRRGRAARRHPHRRPRVGMGLLGERADRPDGGGHRTAGDRGEPRSRHGPSLRRGRRPQRHRRPHDPGLRARGRRERGLGLRPDHRAARARGRVCSCRSW